MNLLFWILEITNVIILSLPLWLQAIKKTKSFLLSRQGVYFVGVITTFLGLMMKLECQDCYKTILVACIPMVLILSDFLIYRVVRASEHNL